MRKRKRITALCLALLAVGAMTAQDLKIYGHMTLSDSFDFPPTGIYAFQPKAGTAITPIFEQSDWYSSGGLVFIDSKLYSVNRDNKKIDVYDTKATPWAAGSQVAFSGFNGATDLTYDITTQKVYGCFIETDKTYSFGTLNLETGERTKIATLPQFYSAIAANSQGTIYGVGADLALYKFDKSTGSATKVGDTGLETIDHWVPQSAEFDQDSNTLYYCYNTGKASIIANNTYLYTINTETGQADKVMQFPQNETFVDIYIPASTQSVGAPAKVEELMASFDKGTGNGKVSFVMPKKSIDGKDISGNLDYTIAIGGETVATGSAKAGDAVSKDVSTTATGETTLAVTLTNGSGKTSLTEKTAFIGIDTPLTVGNLKLSTADNQTVTLTWDAPTAGVHGGYIDPENLTYRVTRMPEGKVCADALTATTFSEKLSAEKITSIYYNVEAKNSAASGEATASNRVNVGKPIETPFNEAFDNDERFATFTVTDGYSDGSTWKRVTNSEDNTSYAVCEYNKNNPKDEWLITPSIKLNKGVRYVLSFKASSVYMTKPEKMEVAYGKGTTPEDMTNVVMKPTVVDNNKSGEWKEYSYIIEVPEDGNYNFGFHAVSDADMFNLALTNVSIEGSHMSAPAEVSNLVATSDANGALTADVVFTTPSKTVGGKDIDKLTKVEVLCNGTLQKTIDNPQPGSEQKATINVNSGSNNISVLAYNEAGASIPAKTTVYAGPDVPGKTTVNVQLKDGKQIVSWEAPKGQNGGYVDPADCKYTVYRFVGDEQKALVEDTEETSYTDDYAATSQVVVTYAVIPNNSLGYGTYSTAHPVVVGGTPYELPYFETFKSGFSTYPIWSMVARSGIGSWVLYDKDKTQGMPKPYDEDGGYIFFSKNNDGDRCQLFSGNIDLKGAKNPTLELWYYNKKSQNTLAIQASADTGTWEDLKVINYNNDLPEGWSKLSLPLSQYKNNSYLQIGFEATANDNGIIAIDAIGVRDLYANDLAVTLSGKKHFFFDADNTLSATVENLGQTVAEDYAVNFYCNDKLFSTEKGTPLAAGETKVVSCNVMLGLDNADTDNYHVEVAYAADENSANNVSDVLAVTNSLPKYPTAKGLAASAEGNSVHLTWTAPETYMAPATEAVTESFEDYTPFTIDDLGDWTLEDVEGEEGTFGLLPLNFPYREAAKSFQVFNADYLHMRSDGDYEVWAAHTGKQMLMAFADKDRLNDDWLISPELSGNKQTIKFWVRSISGNYPNETYSVMASSKGREVTDFTEVAKGEAPLDWTEKEAELPEGTKYFAIRCTSNNCYLMVLDDVTYIPGTGLPSELSLVGYNIYRDGEKINQEPVGTTAFTEKIDISKNHLYAVTAVYATGESRFSNVVALGNLSGVASVESDKVSIKALNSHIIVAQAEGKNITISNAAGAVLFNGKATEPTVSVPAANGIYVVKVGDNVKKIVVRQ